LDRCASSAQGRSSRSRGPWALSVQIIVCDEFGPKLTSGVERHLVDGVSGGGPGRLRRTRRTHAQEPYEPGAAVRLAPNERARRGARTGRRGRGRAGQRPLGHEAPDGPVGVVLEGWPDRRKCWLGRRRVP
jgi:hypothetical protein